MTRLRSFAEATRSATSQTAAAFGAALYEELRMVDASLNRLQEAHCAQQARASTDGDLRCDRLSLLGLEVALQVRAL